MSMCEYLIRNDFTGAIWHAFAFEASCYAIGGAEDAMYSVFLVGGGGTPLLVQDILMR